MKRVVLGVTGGIATGKSTVMALLARAGIPTISADDLSHDCLKRGHPVYKTIIRRFDSEVLGAKRQINRRALGKIVFAVPKKRRWLEKLIHPHVQKAVLKFAKSHNGIVAIDIPLLFEVRWQRFVDKIVVVYATSAQQRERLLRRDGLPEKEIRQRIAAQLSIKEKKKRADYVLDNSGNKGHLKTQIKALLTALVKNA